MSERLTRLLAVIRADFLIRLRRPSTAVVFVLLSALPYLWIPDVSTGRALMQLGGKRALYNSAAIGMATASIGTIFIGLFGFYVISNALRRDVLSRCGFVIASTTMRGSEYIAGKFAGNVVFLSFFTAGFMLVSMAMVPLRGEAALEPFVFAKQYLLLLPPAIAFVSAIAILFEATPVLRTKFGDVLYFFVWLGSLGVVASMMDGGKGPQWALLFDTSGMGFIMQQIQSTHQTNALSIGATTFDKAAGVAVFEGLSFAPRWIAFRVGATLWPLVLLVAARLFFHRFDPARVRAVGNERARRSWLGRLNLLAKPLARVVVRLGNAIAVATSRLPIVPAVVTDASGTFAAFPLAAAGALAFAIAAAAADDAGSLFTGVLPVAFAGMAIAVADVASREKRAGTLPLVFAAPSLRRGFVWWKFASSLLVALAFLAVPLASAVMTRPHAAIALAVAVVFITAAATALGVVSANPKTFLVLFLTFWYVVMSEKGQSPALDFAGWFGTVTPQVIAVYALLATAMLASAHAYHSWELRRRW